MFFVRGACIGRPLQEEMEMTEENQGGAFNRRRSRGSHHFRMKLQFNSTIVYLHTYYMYT